MPFNIMAARFRSNVDHTRLISKSIFVTNFLDNTTSKDLWEACWKSLHLMDWPYALHANVVRFERSPIHSSRPTNLIRSDNTGAPSFASALKDNYIMREVKQFSSINNLHVLLSNEGFQNVKLAYLGGLWVMIELESSKTKTKFMQHVGVASWFSRLCNAQSDFVSRKRIVWVDIEGVPLHAWSLSTFNKIGSRWGEDVVEVMYCSDDEFVKGADENNVKTSKQVNLDAESDVKVVSETYFGEDDDNLGNDQDPIQPLNEKETSNDPFNIYDLLKKYDKGEGGSILEVLDDMIKVGQTMRFSMEGCMKDMENIIRSTWNPNKAKLLMLSICAPQSATGKRSLRSYITSLITRWNGDCMVMGDFNEVRCMEDRMGSVFNVQGANEFNNFISNSGLVEVQLQGYSFTWSHPSATKINIKSFDARGCMQKAKIQWAIEGDENFKFFHGIINRKHANLAIKGVMVDGEWMDDPIRVKEEFRSHLATRFQALGVNQNRLNFRFPNRLNPGQVKWCSWISGSLISGMASILINGSPTSEFQFHCGLKQGDPLAPYLFILIMESLHMSFSRVVDVRIFTGIKIDSSLTISHLFYADDAVFIGKWSNASLTGVGTSNDTITAAALNLGCSVMKTPFKYLGVMVRGSTPIYNMSIYKVPKSVLHLMESIRRNFFNGIQGDEIKITWVKWSKVLASKKYGGLDVSSYYEFNRAPLFKWVWRFISQDNSLWCRFITSMHGSQLLKLSPFHSSTWNTIIQEINVLKSQGVDLISHCKIRVENGMRTQFWNDTWVGDTQLRYMFLRIYALEVNKDRWVWDLNGEGVFRVKDLRNLLDESFLEDSTATRWVKSIPIKINVFARKVYLDWLPTRLNLIRRGVQVPCLSCPVCNVAYEDISHLLFSCDLANDVVRLVCRWWNLTWSPLSSCSEWLS
nr:RNA-directed DNA polymerase, eukaryota [Tanacetum cinerariifolium]